MNIRPSKLQRLYSIAALYRASHIGERYGVVIGGALHGQLFDARQIEHINARLSPKHSYRYEWHEAAGEWRAVDNSLCGSSQQSMEDQMTKREQARIDKQLEALDEADPEGAAVVERQGRTLKLAMAGAVLLSVAGCTPANISSRCGAQDALRRMGQ